MSSSRMDFIFHCLAEEVGKRLKRRDTMGLNVEPSRYLSTRFDGYYWIQLPWGHGIGHPYGMHKMAYRA